VKKLTNVSAKKQRRKVEVASKFHQTCRL